MRPRRGQLYAPALPVRVAALCDLAADPRHLGAAIGELMVLHTWGGRLQLHPHVHCVIPAGGLDRQGRWLGIGERFFLPVHALAAAFRNRFVSGLEGLVGRHEIVLPPDLAESPSLYATWLAGLRAKRWKVYVKPPFGGPVQVLRYLSRYTHRVAISNERLLGLDGDRVLFRYKDSAADETWKSAKLDAVEFLRRFSQHILPRGFVRIRYYGLLSNRRRRESVAAIREQLGVADGAAYAAEVDIESLVHLDRWTCPDCGSRLVITATVALTGAPRVVVAATERTAVSGVPHSPSEIWTPALGVSVPVRLAAARWAILARPDPDQRLRRGADLA